MVKIYRGGGAVVPEWAKAWEILLAVMALIVATLTRCMEPTRASTAMGE